MAREVFMPSYRNERKRQDNTKNHVVKIVNSYFL